MSDAAWDSTRLEDIKNTRLHVSDRLADNDHSSQKMSRMKRQLTMQVIPRCAAGTEKRQLMSLKRSVSELEAWRQRGRKNDLPFYLTIAIVGTLTPAVCPCMQSQDPAHPAIAPDEDLTVSPSLVSDDSSASSPEFSSEVKDDRKKWVFKHNRWVLVVSSMETTKRIDSRLYTFSALVHLASTHSKAKRWAEAETLYAVIAGMRKRAPNALPQTTIDSLSELAEICERRRRFGDAEELHVAVFRMRKRVLGDRHPLTLESLRSLASFYDRMGRKNEASAITLTL